MKCLIASKINWLLIGIVCMNALMGTCVRANVIYGTPTQVANMNTTSSEESPSISANGLELYFSSAYPQGGDGCYNDIWIAPPDHCD